MSTDYDFRLIYFPVRARLEPILLRIVDAGVPFQLEEIPLAAWSQWKKTHQIARDKFPFSGVPILRAKYGGKELVLGETSAILTFLDETLAPAGTHHQGRDLPLDVRVHIQMIKEASLFFLGRSLQMSGSSEVSVIVFVSFPVADQDCHQWLAPPQRTITRKGMVARYLKNTEGALHDLQRSIRVVPLPTDQLSGMTTAVVTAITVIRDLFPSTREMLMEGGEYELLGRLWHTVHGRPRIKEYWEKNQIEQKAWTITEYGTAEWIAKEAASFDKPASLL
ncbi:hypothetical protein V8B97DRAFT_1985426 [Scleroderma yunnanense]